MGVANPELYNWSFFGVGVGLIGAGLILSRRRAEIIRRR